MSYILSNLDRKRLLQNDERNGILGKRLFCGAIKPCSQVSRRKEIPVFEAGESSPMKKFLHRKDEP
jgi:hypothetical protein